MNNKFQGKNYGMDEWSIFSILKLNSKSFTRKSRYVRNFQRESMKLFKWNQQKFWLNLLIVIREALKFKDYKQTDWICEIMVHSVNFCKRNFYINSTPEIKHHYLFWESDIWIEFWFSDCLIYCVKSHLSSWESEISRKGEFTISNEFQEEWNFNFRKEKEMKEI
jgi:hypothetical protein